MKNIIKTVARAWETIVFLPFRSAMPVIKEADHSAFTAPIVLHFDR